MMAALDPNPIKKFPIPIIGMLTEMSITPHPMTVSNQELN